MKTLAENESGIPLLDFGKSVVHVLHYITEVLFIAIHLLFSPIAHYSLTKRATTWKETTYNADI